MMTVIAPSKEAPVASALTWLYVVSREPRIQELHDEARTANKVCWCCRWDGYRDRGRAHEGMKDRMSRLVGWYSKHPDPDIRSSRAYDIVYERLVHAFPFDPATHCRICGEPCI